MDKFELVYCLKGEDITVLLRCYLAMAKCQKTKEASVELEQVIRRLIGERKVQKVV